MAGIFCFFLASTLGAQILSWSFDGAIGDEESFLPDTVGLGISASSMVRGLGLTSVSGAGAFNARGFSTGAIESEDYFGFSLAPEAGMRLSLSSLRLDERRSLSGIREWSVRSSLDNYTTDLRAFSVPDNSDTRIGQTISLGNSFNDLDHMVEFRFFGYEAESSLGTWRIDNVSLDGLATPVPEPETYMIVVASGLILFSLVRRYYQKSKA